MLAQQIGEPFARSARPGCNDDPAPLAIPTLGLGAQLIEHVGPGAAATLEEDRAGTASTVDADRAVWPRKRRERKQRPTRQHGVPASLVQTQPLGTQRPIR